MTGGSVGMASRVPSLRYESSISVVSCWSVVSKLTGSFARCLWLQCSLQSVLSSVLSNLFFSSGSKSNRDEKSATAFFYPWMCAMVKLNCKTTFQDFHKSGRVVFVEKIE